MLRWLLAAGFALGAAAGWSKSAAQSQAQRTLIEAFRDSLDRATDSSALVRLDSRMVKGARGGRDAFHHLRMGFLALRLGDLGRARSFEDAAIEFETATRLAPAWPFGWYGLGLAEYALGRASLNQVSTGDGLNPARAYNRAMGALARAASTDPSFSATIVEEAFLGRRARQQSRSTIALEALRIASRPMTRSPQVLHGLGTVEREFGDPAAALRAFDALLTMTPARSRGVPLLEVARTRFLLGRLDGAAPYYEGAGYDDSATVLAYRGDLAPLASERELAELDSRRGADRVAYLRRFWGARDAADFRESGERLREHYRRLFVARRTFPSYLPTRWRDMTRRIAIADDVDDRGLIFIRHGDPDDRVALNTFGFQPNESWRYTPPEGELVLHFVAPQALDDFRLVESLFDVAEAQAPGAPRAAPGRTERDELLLRSREQLSPFYRRQPQASEQRQNFLAAERSMSRTSLGLATTTDDFRRRYARTLDARTDLALVGETAEGILAHVAIAVPFPTTAGAWLGEGVTFPLRVRLVALSPEGSTVAATDTTLRAAAVSYGDLRWLAAVLSVPVPPGPLRLRVAVEDDRQQGSVLPFRTLRPPAGDSGLALSDVAVGAIAGPWRARAGDGSVVLNPVGLTRGRPAELAFAVRARSGELVTCQVTVIRTDDQPGVAYSERWSEAMTQGARLVRHRLQTRELKPGRYRAEVTVSQAGAGGPVRQWREFEVR
jgi:GWxTD domain-containing protein